MASVFPFTRGSKEIVPAEVVDRSGATTDLSTATPKYWLREPDGSTMVYDNANATAVGLIISCMVDSSSGGPNGLLDPGDYDFWVGWTRGSEIIKKYVGVLRIADTF